MTESSMVILLSGEERTVILPLLTKDAFQENSSKNGFTHFSKRMGDTSSQYKDRSAHQSNGFKAKRSFEDSKAELKVF